jgi:hypothetical protein
MVAGGRRQSNRGLKPKTKTSKPLAADSKIRLIAKSNPHRKATNDFGKFKKLSTGMTVEAAVAAGVDRGYLRYAAAHSILALR